MAAIRAPGGWLRPNDACLPSSLFLGTPLVFSPAGVRNVASSPLTFRFELRAQATADRTNRTRRRGVLLAAGAVLAWPSTREEARAARNSMQGFKPAIDKGDGYVFFYPFGWEEISVKGQDIVYKDVIEPLESVSVNVVKTAKADIHEFGSPEELSKVLIDRFLAPTQKAQLIEAKERENDGVPYYTFEFLAKAPNYTRHALAAVTVAKGKFYALVTGANERRWSKMKDRLHTVVDSFALLK